MDAEYLAMVISNMSRQHNDAAYNTAVSVLADEQALPGQPGSPGAQESLDLAVKIGEAIKDLLWEYAKAEHGIADDETTLTATILAAAISHTSSADLGHAYYVTACERYAYQETGQPPAWY